MIDLGSTTASPVSLSCGAGAACAVMSDGTVRCWGDTLQQYSNGYCNIGVPSNELPYNQAAQVDLGSYANVSKVSLGLKSSCAITNATCVKCWGTNYEQLYYPPSTYASNRCISYSSSDMGDNLTCVQMPVQPTEILDMCNPGPCIFTF